MQKVLADVMLNARVQESRKLARQVQQMALFRLQKRTFRVRDNGVKSAPFHVLLGAQMPAVLVELGYCTHADEARNLKTPNTVWPWPKAWPKACWPIATNCCGDVRQRIS